MARSTSKPTTSRAPRKPRPKLQTADIKEQMGEEATAATKEIGVPNQPKKRDVGPATQKVIDRILELRKSGLGYPSICKTLNEDKVPTFKGGETWYPPVVRGICIRNGVERGTKAEAE